MSNLPSVVLPEEHGIYERFIGIDGYEKSISMTIVPYRQDVKWLTNTIREKQITVPFDKVITKDQGSSECRMCKAKYVGTQEFCTNRVWKHYNTKYWNSNWDHGYDNNGKNKEGLCQGSLIWDLQAQFDAQKEFFDFVELMGNLTSVDLIAKHAHLLPAGQASEYRISKLQNDIVQLEMRMANAFNQIASKMNQAGHSLMF